MGGNCGHQMGNLQPVNKLDVRSSHLGAAAKISIIKIPM